MTLLEFLEKTDMTQREMARRLDVSQPTVTKWVRGRFIPTMPNLIRITEVTDGLVRYDDFVRVKQQAGQTEKVL